MDDYDWDALNWLESRCMDYAEVDGKQCYPDYEPNDVDENDKNMRGNYLNNML